MNENNAGIKCQGTRPIKLFNMNEINAGNRSYTPELANSERTSDVKIVMNLTHSSPRFSFESGASEGNSPTKRSVEQSTPRNKQRKL